MRIRRAVTGIFCALVMTVAGPAAAQADTYTDLCPGAGTGVILQQGANGSAVYMWYDQHGNWGYTTADAVLTSSTLCHQ